MVTVPDHTAKQQQCAICEPTHKREDFQLFGPKGECEILKVNPITLTLDDVTNPVEEGEIPRYSKGIEEVEFRIKAESLKEVNDKNSALRVQDGGETAKKSNISFSDVNGRCS